MDRIIDTMEGQHLAPLEECVVEDIMADPLAVGVIGALDWRTMDVGSLKDMIPGCGDALDLLVHHGIVIREGDDVRLSEPYQAYGTELDRDDGVWTMLTSPKDGWGHQMGFLSSYVVCSLVSMLFDVEPTWEDGTLELAERSGLVSEGMLTPYGRDVAFRLFSTVAGMFDTVEVDPDDLFGRWSGTWH